MVEIIAIETPSLGDCSYLIHDGRVATVVDPQRDIDRALARAERLGGVIRHVFETYSCSRPPAGMSSQSTTTSRTLRRQA